MDGLCMKCARLSLQRQGIHSRTPTTRSIRRFSVSTHVQDDPNDTSMGIGSKRWSATQRSSDVPVKGDQPPQTRPPSTKQAVRSAPAQSSARPAVSQVLIRKTQTTWSTAAQSSARPAARQVLIKKIQSTGSTPEAPGATALRIIRTQTNGNPPGPVLRRVNVPQRTPGLTSRPGSVLQRTGAPRSTPQGQAGRGGPRQGGKPTGDRRRRRTTFREDDMTGEDVTEAEVEALLDPSPNPTEALPYKPNNLSLEDLRADWPDTAISPIGVVESVQQRIEFLARRIPHGYLTAEELAEHYQKGNLTRFESTEERDNVLELAKGLAAKRADMLTERKSEVIEPEDMSFSDLATTGETATLAEKMVRGVYPQVQKQRMPFLDNVTKTLWNNETYHGVEQDRFMQKVRSLMPQQSGAGRNAQQQKSA